MNLGVTCTDVNSSMYIYSTALFKLGVCKRALVQLFHMHDLWHKFYPCDEEYTCEMDSGAVNFARKQSCYVQMNTHVCSLSKQGSSHDSTIFYQSVLQ